MNKQVGYYACSRPEVQKLVRSDARYILDVGCGEGQLGYELKQKQSATIWGVEFIPDVAGVAAGRLDRVICGSIEDTLSQLPDGYFDTIICADVLEHLVDPWQILGDLRPKLASGGDLVASIPNVQHWSVLKKLLEGRWQYQDAGILDRTHLRFFTWKECIQLFHRSGYNIKHAEATLLNSDQHFPDTAIRALKEAGLLVDTLAQDSMHYQFLIVGSAAEVAAKQHEPPKLDSIHTVDSVRAAEISGLTSIIILTWNQLSHTQACLESIASYTDVPYELIIVDNGSTDGTVEWLKSSFVANRRVRLIENTTNRGYAAGCNQGMEIARGDKILLLNNDTVVTPEWLRGMNELLDWCPDVGIVGPLTNNASGIQAVVNCDFRDLQQLPAWATAFRNSFRFRTVRQRRIVGFCMLFRKALVEQIGLLDESFGVGNFEDDDYCLRAELAGYRNLVAADVFIHHTGGASFTGNQLHYDGLLQCNHQIFAKKWSLVTLEERLAQKLQALKTVELAQRQMQRGYESEAVDIIYTLLSSSSSANSEIYLASMEVLLRLGRYQDVLAALSRIADIRSRSSFFELESVCYCALGNADKAESAALQALDCGRAPQALVVLGTLAARQGDLMSAEKMFRDSLTSDPRCSEAWLSLGMLLWSKGDHQIAWQAARRSVVIDPLNPKAIGIFLDMAQRTGQSADALQVLGGAVQLYPESRHLAFVSIELLAQCGDVSLGLEACEDFLARFGADDELLALALTLRGKTGPYNRLTVGGDESISLCMIVKDEERHLPACLASIKPVVHEIVVVDTGSSDRTIAIATVFGARVVSFTWNDSFADARNYGLGYASAAWIIVMDADERIAPQDYRLLQECVRRTNGLKTAWNVLTRNYTAKVNACGWVANNGTYPLHERAGGSHPSWKVRLFPNKDAVYFNGDLHETVEASLSAAGCQINQAPFIIHHYGGLEDDRQKVVTKRQRYFEIGLKKLENNPDDTTALRELAIQAGELGRMDDAIELWNQILADEPDNLDAMYNKAAALMGVCRYQEALVLSEKALALSPEHKEAAFNYATCSLYAGDPEKAVVLIERLLARYPEYPPLNAVLTALYIVVGKIAQALELVARLRQMNVALCDYIRDRAMILEKLGRSDSAERLRQGWSNVEKMK